GGLVIGGVIGEKGLRGAGGVVRAFAAFFPLFGRASLVPLTALALVSASLSGMMAWLAGPSKGLLKIGRDYGYLPPYFQQLNEDGIQTHILVAQGVVTTVIGLLYAFIPSVSTADRIFSVMTAPRYLIWSGLMSAGGATRRRTDRATRGAYLARALRTWSGIGGIP